MNPENIKLNSPTQNTIAPFDMITDISKEQIIISNEQYTLNKTTYNFEPKYFLFFIKYISIGNCKWIFPYYQINSLQPPSPKIIIGPHWYCYFIMLFIIYLIVNLITSKLFPFITNSFTKKTFWVLLFHILIVYTINLFYNPGIAMDESPTNDKDTFCSRCRKYISSKGTVHCNFCDTCIEGYDHHCVWIGKCVGRKNKCIFMYIFFTMILEYGLLIIVLIFHYLLVNK